MAAEELVLDDGVLQDKNICEFQGMQAVRRCGGLSVLTWRSDWHKAEAYELRSISSGDLLQDARFAQCLVHLQKSRPATWQDLAHAWAHLEPGGRLLFCGGNDLGITSAVKRLAQQLDQKPRILSNRRHARIVVFERDSGAGPVPPEPDHFQVHVPPQPPFSLRADPGVFSARRLDPGSELLLEALAEVTPARRILDLGCGAGPLGLSALQRWPHATGLLLDGDARAVHCATDNASALGLEERCQVDWWDVREPVPMAEFDLILLNPPFHEGKQVDLGPAHAMFETAHLALAPEGRALIVANRTLPYERSLRELGTVEMLKDTRTFKVLSLGAS
ncbi:MAG: methyltransferase [Myxococcota bacterium]|nr:methyltransferase [Myxococcota bacterium]